MNDNPAPPLSIPDVIKLVEEAGLNSISEQEVVALCSAAAPSLSMPELVDLLDAVQHAARRVVDAARRVACDGEVLTDAERRALEPDALLAFPAETVAWMREIGVLPRHAQAAPTMH